MYDEYLNHKSHLACETDPDIHQHNLDSSKIFDFLYEAAPAGAIVKVSFQDPYHEKEEPAFYQLIDQDGYDDFIQGFDVKNGIDFVVFDGEMGIAVYGQNYSYEGDTYMNEALLQFHFLDPEKTNYTQIQEQLDCMDRLDQQQILLTNLYNSDIFLPSIDFIEKLRDSNRRPLQEQINSIKNNPVHSQKSVNAKERSHNNEQIK